MLKILSNIVSDDGKPDFKISMWDNFINLAKENPNEFWKEIFAIIGIITVIIIPIKYLIKKGRKWINNTEEEHE